ncbi:hypothetical protein OPIT5_10925 [Opitutaceae bacterium TAV5]|nr:hypothetical protein OPIT5_10925 [Opitutaceae bacterium TAV5]
MRLYPKQDERQPAGSPTQVPILRKNYHERHGFPGRRSGPGARSPGPRKINQQRSDSIRLPLTPSACLQTQKITTSPLI